MLLSISPHMHFRGKSFTAKLEMKQEPQNGSGKKVLLKVPQYDFNWQHPEKYVTWGDQTWEEMAIGFFDVSVPRKPSKKKPAKRFVDEPGEPTRAELAKLESKIDNVVNDFFKRFDDDKDGLIQRSELPLSMQSRRGYSKFNTDGERGLTRDEVAAEARNRLEKRN